MEKAGLENIKQLLEIIEAEHNHELLLTVRNLRELVACAFPYIIPVVSRSLPSELIEGEHFVLVDFFKSSPGSSSREVVAKENQAEDTTGALVSFVRVT